MRRNRYKVAVDAEEGRRRREDNMVEIRKNRREESLQKKRREGLVAPQMPSTPTSEKKVTDSLSLSLINHTLRFNVLLLLTMIQSPKLKASQCFRF